MIFVYCSIYRIPKFIIFVCFRSSVNRSHFCSKKKVETAKLWTKSGMVNELDWLIDWLIDRSIYWLIDRLIDILILIYWLIDYKRKKYIFCVNLVIDSAQNIICYLLKNWVMLLIKSTSVHNFEMPMFVCCIKFINKYV